MKAVGWGGFQRHDEKALLDIIIRRVPVPAEGAFGRDGSLSCIHFRAWGGARNGRTITRTRQEAHRAGRRTESACACETGRVSSALIDKYSDDVFAEFGGDAGPSSALLGRSMSQPA